MLISMLQSIPYFNSSKKLSYGDFRELSQLLKLREYEPNSLIYSEGDAPEYFFIVLTGSVCEFQKNRKIRHWDRVH